MKRIILENRDFRPKQDIRVNRDLRSKRDIRKNRDFRPKRDVRVNRDFRSKRDIRENRDFRSKQDIKVNRDFPSSLRRPPASVGVNREVPRFSQNVFWDIFSQIVISKAMFCIFIYIFNYLDAHFRKG